MEEKKLKEIFVDLIIDNEMLINKICHIYSSNHHDFEDLRQEIICQLWKSYPSFRNESKVQTWMYRVALNTALYIKRKNRVTYTPLSTKNDVVDDTEGVIEKEEKFKLLYAAIQELDHLDKAIMLLYLEKYPYEKISEIVGISEKNVGVKITRIKEGLRRKLNNQ